LFVIRVVLLLIVMFCVLFVCKCVLPPGVNPIAVDKYINIDINILSVSLLLGIQQEKYMRHILLPLWPVRLYPVIPHYLHERYDVSGKYY
jgi:hypothetical protein